jgi:hypothetical protein
MQVRPALVKSVQGTTCTVSLVGAGLADVAGINLRADEDAGEGLLFAPRVGSLVYVAALENADTDDLFVVACSEVDRLEARIGDVQLRLDGEQVELTQGGASLRLAAGKLSVAVDGVSLKSLFDDLASVIENLKVLCGPAGSPSTALFPATLTAVQQLKTSISQLLQ